MRTDSIITSDRPLPSIGVVCSVAVLAVAILGAVSSLVVNGIRSNHITLVETQQAVSEAHLSRARSCMDMAATGIDDPDLLERARLQVNMSNGIVLCLVRNRENAVLDITSAARCVRDLEIENQLAVEDAHGMISTVPPC